MGGRSWTELFFLDEAVALAAGHRPCFCCRRAAAEAFRTAWGKAKGGKAPLGLEMDAVLHEERLDRGRKRVHAIPGPIAELPDGTVIAALGEAYTIVQGRSFRWSEQGYQLERQIPLADGLLTPPSTLLAIRAGYRPALHPNLRGISSCFIQLLPFADVLYRSASVCSVKAARRVTRRPCRISSWYYWLSPSPHLRRRLWCTGSKREN